MNNVYLGFSFPKFPKGVGLCKNSPSGVGIPIRRMRLSSKKKRTVFPDSRFALALKNSCRIHTRSSMGSLQTMVISLTMIDMTGVLTQPKGCQQTLSIIRLVGSMPNLGRLIRSGSFPEV